MKYTLLGGTSAKTVEDVLNNRGLSSKLIRYANDESAVHDPFLLENMEEAVKLVKKHMDAGNRIYIQQDPDADGLTSTALLVLYLQDLYPDLDFVVGIHEGKEHGINMETVKELLSLEGKKPSLIIAPDASSNEYSKHKELKDLGLDVLVLDHHDTKAYSRSAVVVNPQLDDYPNKNISGVGVVQKFARAYDIKYQEGDTTFSDKYYDLVAVGMVGDMIEITTPEAVFMVQQGMANVQNTFLKALYAKQDYSMRGKITPMGIAFYITPLLNAVVRTATMEEKQLVLEAMLEVEERPVPSTKRGNKPGDTEIIQEQAARIMTNIRSRQARMVDKAMEVIEDKIERQELYKNQLIVVDVKHKFEKELTGLIANKIMAEHKKPILIGSVVDGMLMGSGRGDDKSSLPDLKGFLQDSKIVEYAEGHGSAHGFGVMLDKLPSLIEHSNRELSDLDFTPRFLVDFVWEPKDINMPFLEELIRLESFWARGIDEPYFVIKNLRVPKEAVSLTGSFDLKTLKIELDGFSIIQFRVPVEKTLSFTQNQSTVIDLVGRVSLNEFRGKKTVQIFMEDYEVRKAQKFYF